MRYIFTNAAYCYSSSTTDGYRVTLVNALSMYCHRIFCVSEAPISVSSCLLILFPLTSLLFLSLFSPLFCCPQFYNLPKLKFLLPLFSWCFLLLSTSRLHSSFRSLVNISVFLHSFVLILPCSHLI